MRYYMLLLMKGRVVDIASFDEEATDETVKLWQKQLENSFQNGYDEVQTLNEVR